MHFPSTRATILFGQITRRYCQILQRFCFETYQSQSPLISHTPLVCTDCPFGPASLIALPPQMARVQNAVYYDAVWLVAYGLRSLYASGTIANRVDVDSLSALTLSDAMRAQAFVGMTGPISYDARSTTAANDRRGSDYALYNVLGMNAQVRVCGP
jgi:hypothetical protein